MPSFTRVKICGITTVESARMAVEAGADALGLVFYEKSPRNVSIQVANEIAVSIPAFVSRVALFKDAEADFVHQVLENVDIDCLQFHGSESADFCISFNRPYIKALSATDDLVEQAGQYTHARAVLVDSHAPGEDGGTGNTFDWTCLPDKLPLPLILAGGLNATNVAEAIETVHPYAVDVSSGVEKIKGVKDAALITAFMKEVNYANGR